MSTIRSQPSGRKLEPLGASEFAATLNGDNPTAILQVLKRFTKTVRRERRMALEESSDEKYGQGGGHNDDASSSSSSSDESEEGEKNVELQPPPAKKFKKTELWKEDTNAYHVPFVGTAVSRGDIAEVVKGEWPTGLLQMYLKKSPMAIELTGDDWIPSSTSTIHKSLLRRKQTKLSREIYKAYLKALSEVVTAAIPIDKLREDLSAADGEDDNANKMDLDLGQDEQQLHPFLSALLKKRLVGMFHLMVEETDKGRGKPGIYGGCGSLVPLALQFLQNVSQTSISNARLICRYLDEELSDGVLKAIIRPPPPPRNIKDLSDDPIDKAKAFLTKPSRVEAIRLATILLQTADSAVATYICTAGSRERKVKPGILYGAFREGLAKHSQADSLGGMDDGEDYFDCVADMLEFSRKLLKNPRLSKVVGTRLLFDLFSRDTLYHLCDLSARAPPMSTGRTFLQVLSGTDEIEEDDTDALSYAGREARRLLFLLLGDLVSSPLLGSSSSKVQTHVLVNVMLRMLQTRNAGVQMRQFLLHCVETSPLLLPEFFRMILIPDSKKSFEFMSVLRFVSNLIENGPAPFLCLHDPLDSHADSADLADIFAVLCPLKLKRQAVGKAMQSGDPLVVLECVKFVRSVLGRFQSLIKGMTGDKHPKAFIARLTAEFAQLLPDLQVILAVRSKYDLASGSKGTDLVCHGLHLLLETYSETLPEQIRISSFDWMKLLPQPKELLKASPLVQRKVVSCLCSVLRVCVGMPSNYVNSLVSVLEIMLRTKDKVVHTKCREIAIILLVPVVESRSTSEESIAYLKLEVSWWLDALTLQSLPVFCSVVALCTDDSLAVLGRTGRALSANVETMQLHWSIILIAALSEIDCDAACCQMTVQVATRSLLFQRNPVPFACFMMSLTSLPESPAVSATPSGRALIEYAKSLAEFEETPAKKRLDQLTSLLRCVFSPQHEFCDISGSFTSEQRLDDALYPRSIRRAIELARFAVHVRMISPGLARIHKSCNEVLRRTIPDVLLDHGDQSKIFSSQLIKDVQTMNEENSFSVVDAILLSHPGWGQTGTPVGGNGEPSISSFPKNPVSVTLEDKEARLFLLQLALLGRAPSSNTIVQTQLKLLEGDRPNNTAASINVQAILSLASICDSVHRYDFKVIARLFEVWWSTPGDEFSGVFSQQLYCPLRTYLAQRVSSVLSTTSLEATFLLTIMTTKSEDIIIDRCLGLDHPTDDQDEMQANARVLESIIQFDPLRFAPYLIVKFHEKGFLHSAVWSKGLLDGAVKKIVGHPAIQCMGDSSLSSLGNAVLYRACTVLEKMTDVRTGILSCLFALCMSSVFKLTVRLLAGILGQAQMHGQWQDVLGTLDLANETLLSDIIVVPVDELATMISESLCATFSDGKVVKSEALGSVCRLGMTLIRRKTADSHPSRKALGYLSSALFCVLLDLLMVSYKKISRGGEQLLDCQTILTFLMSLLEREQEFDPTIISRANDSLLQKVCRNGLKHGIHDDEGSAERLLAASSLRFVRHLSVRLSKSPTLSDHFETIAPSELFEMLTSHSKFVAMVTRKRGPFFEESDRVELVRLIHCCVELSPCQTVVKQGLWELLNHAFGAGLDELDTSIRRFFYACSTTGGKNISLPFLDEARWSSCAEVQSREGRRWDWLLDALDINRIRETVACFPINDTLDLNTNTSEPTTTQKDGYENDDIVGDESDGSDDSGKTGIAKVGPNEPTPVDGSFNKLRSTRRDEDVRYSPAFILSLVLGALHSCLPQDDKAEREVQEGQEVDEESKYGQLASYNMSPLVSTAKVLIEKGIPALCLACLASACERIRTVSISILGIFLKACNTDEARTMSSWRERPQIAMLLNAVQRAYVLERAKLPYYAEVDILRLPSLVSTFLARSSLSISRPDDSLYVPLNRFFLKSDADHGAFQDMSRLPSFISLFCSVNHDPTQSRKERMWALQLIRDGFLDSSCYRLVSSCHAPELLLSSFENVRLSSFSDEMKGAELVLLLGSIKTFLDNGGRRASSHLIGRMGLLSWLRSLCSSRPISVTFPLESTRVAACELVQAAIQAVSRNVFLFKSELVDEVCGLIIPTFELCSGIEVHKRGGSPVVGPFLRTLSTIRDLLHKLDGLEDFECPHIHPSGLRLDYAIHFWKLLPPDDQPECIAVLAHLPCRLDQGSTLKSAAALCACLLEWSSNSTAQLPGETAKAILNRVILIADHFGGDFGPGFNESLTQTLLSSRDRYQGNEESSLLWIECLELLSLRLREEGMVAQLAADVLNQT